VPAKAFFSRANELFLGVCTTLYKPGQLP